jgi:1,4-alpha-glucan branching enzyme
MIRYTTMTRVCAILGLVGCGSVPGQWLAPSPSGKSDSTGQGGPAPLGGHLHAGGASFGAWAPNAELVEVAGDFGTVPMMRGDGGIWTADVAGATAGQSYQYVIHFQGKTFDRADPRSVQLVGDSGRKQPRSVLYDAGVYLWQNDSFVPPSPERQVVYELHVGTFNDVAGPGTGTWQSAIARLDALADLGINMIEVMPPGEFPGSYGWGYDPNFPFAPVGLYGTPDDMKAFVDRAHGLGMGVIVDVVHNHYSKDDRDHPSLSMWCFDTGDGCADGGIYFAGEPGSPWGPRPNYAAPEVHDLVVDSVLAWARDYHVDGFRWDSCIYTRRTDWNPAHGQDLPDGARLMKDMNAAVHALKPSIITIAEDLVGWSAITNPLDPAHLNDYGSGYGFDGQWDDGFFYDVKRTVVAAAGLGAGGSLDLGAITGSIQRTYSGDVSHRVIYTEDHDKVAPQNGADKVRLPVAIAPSDPTGLPARKLSTLGAGVLLTTPAVPMLFQGQEFLETLPFPFNRGTALDWANADRYSGIRSLYRDLIRMRKNAGGNTAGLTGRHVRVSHADPHTAVVVYHRWDRGGPGDDVIVVLNLGPVTQQPTIGLPAAGTWYARFNSDAQRYSPDFGNTPAHQFTATAMGQDGEPYATAVTVGPYSLLVMSQ